MSSETPNPLLAQLADLTAAPFIPELHHDDCDDLACARCVPPSQISQLDMPLPELIRNVKEKAAMKQAHMVTALLSEERHQCDPADAAFAGLACSCKTPLASDADYPGFADWVAQQEALNEQYRRAA